MLLRLVALVLTALLGRSALAASVAPDASWSSVSRWEALHVAPAQPPSRLAGAPDIPAPPEWRPVQPRGKAASAPSSTHALLAERSGAYRTHLRASRIVARRRAFDALRRSFAYDATAPPGA